MKDISFELKQKIKALVLTPLQILMTFCIFILASFNSYMMKNGLNLLGALSMDMRYESQSGLTRRWCSHFKWTIQFNSTIQTLTKWRTKYEIEVTPDHAFGFFEVTPFEFLKNSKWSWFHIRFTEKQINKSASTGDSFRIPEMFSFYSSICLFVCWKWIYRCDLNAFNGILIYLRSVFIPSLFRHLYLRQRKKKRLYVCIYQRIFYFIWREKHTTIEEVESKKARKMNIHLKPIKKP